MIELKMELLGVPTTMLAELEKLAEGSLKGVLEIGDSDRRGHHNGHRVAVSLKTSRIVEGSRVTTKSDTVYFTPLSALLEFTEVCRIFPRIGIPTMILTGGKQTSGPKFPTQPDVGSTVTATSAASGLSTRKFMARMRELLGSENINAELPHRDFPFRVQEVTEKGLIKLAEPDGKVRGDHELWQILTEENPDGVDPQHLTLVVSQE